VREIEPRQAPSYDAIARRRLGKSGAGRRASEIDLAGHRPVVLADRAPRAQEASILDRERLDWAGEAARHMRKKQRAHLGARQANRAARYGDGVAARGEALRRACRRLPRYDAQALRLHVELLGGDLRERGEHALADFDLAGGKPYATRLLETDPRRKQGII